MKLTLYRKGIQDRQTNSKNSNQKAPSRRNNRSCPHNIRQRVLFLCSLQGHMYNDVGTLKILLNGNFRHRNLKNILFKGQKRDYLRIADLAICLATRKTKQNLRSRFEKRIACWKLEVESQIRLPC